MIKYIDIAVNLFNKQFRNHEFEVINNAVFNDIGMIVTGTDMKSNNFACGFIEGHNLIGVWSTAGIHPHNANSWNEDYKKHLYDLLANHSCIKAIGEIGLDFDRMYSTKENQIKCFDEVLKLAEGYNKPLFLHERSAVDDFINILKSHKSLCEKSVVHCFTGTRETALKYLDLGCYIGITGWICDDRRNGDLLDALKVVPLDRLLVETDSPYLTPKGLGLNSTNVPRNVVYVVDKIAKIKGLDREEVRTKTLQNTINLFKLDI